jgi:hypothetical protein
LINAGVERELDGDVPLTEWRPAAWACSKVREKDPALDPDAAAARERLPLAASASWRSLAAAIALAASSSEGAMERAAAARS